MASNNLAKGLKRSALTLALSMCFVGAAIAANSGGLRISIKGADGQPVAGATVRLSSPSSLISKSGVTDANGNVNIVGGSIALEARQRMGLSQAQFAEALGIPRKTLHDKLRKHGLNFADGGAHTIPGGPLGSPGGFTGSGGVSGLGGVGLR